MIDHMTLHVSDGAKSKAFYTGALAPLGYTIIMEFGPAFGMGVAGKPDFWVSPDGAGKSMHIAFRTDRKGVDAFHAAALEAGGNDNGKPGLRPHYHPHYYGAFVLDPDGNNIEAVCHDPA